MPIRVNVTLNSGANLISERFDNGQQAAGMQALAEMEQYVPMQQGNLRDSGILSQDGKTVSYHTPYAKAQFYGFSNGGRIRNYSTPGTSRRWDLRLAGNSQKMSNVKKAFVKGGGF